TGGGGCGARCQRRPSPEKGARRRPLDRLYLAVRGRGEQADLDAAIDALVNRHQAADAFWQDFRLRVGAFAKRQQVDVALQVRPEYLEVGAPLLRRYAGPLGGALDRGEPVGGPFDPADRPVWDAGTRTLYYKGVRVRKPLRRYKGSHLETILQTFTDDGWPPGIDDPVPHDGPQPASEKRQENVKQLNEGLTAIRFFTAGDGYGWRVRPATYP